MARIWIYWLRLHFKKDLFLNHPNIIYNLINFCSAMSTLFRRSLPLYCTFIINLRWKQSTKTKTFNLLEYFVRSSIKLFAIKPNERKSEWVSDYIRYFWLYSWPSDFITIANVYTIPDILGIVVKILDLLIFDFTYQ